ncbi:MAG: hypothetical protein ACLUGQ_01955 [Coprococcus sp.]
MKRYWKGMDFFQIRTEMGSRVASQEMVSFETAAGLQWKHALQLHLAEIRFWMRAKSSHGARL